MFARTMLFSACVAPATLGQVTFTQLQLPANATAVHATAVGGDGHVAVGYARIGLADLPFRWTDGQPESLGSSWAPSAVSPSAQFMAGSMAFGSEYAACKWTAPGPPVQLPEVPGFPLLHSIGLGITPDGSTVVGYYRSGLRTKPAIWDSAGGRFLEFPPDFDGSARSISATGVAVGWVSSTSGGPTLAARWSPSLQLLTPPPEIPGEYFPATDVSADGSVIVGYGSGAGALSPIRWVNGAPTLLGQLNTGSITRVSDDGWRVVAGTYLWDPAAGWRTMASILASAGQSFPAGWIGNGAIDISADGTTILGTSLNDQGRNVAWTLRIPRFCYANCDGSSLAPALNVLDFNCFLNRFTADDLYADCNLDGATNVLDFNCFLNRFTVGCP